MNGHTDSLSPGYEPIKTIRSDDSADLLARLTDPRHEQLDLGRELPLNLVVGIDPSKDSSYSGWTCLIDVGAGIPSDVSLLRVDGTTVSQQETQMIPSTDVAKISFGGRDWYLDRDAWGNPYLYPYRETRTELGERIYKVMEKSIQVWSDALVSEEAVRKYVTEIYGEEVMANIAGIIEQLESYPELQQNPAWVVRTDLRDIVYRGKTVERSMQILRGEESGTQPPPDLTRAKAWDKCQEVLAKLVNQQALTQEDQWFLAAFDFVDIAAERSVRDFNRYKITDLNRRFVIANVVENLLCREVVGWDIYEQHKSGYEDFKRHMQEVGYEIPAWFTPYAGNELRWGFALDLVLANAAGKFFLETKLTPDFLAHLINHERVHRLTTTACELGFKKVQQLEQETGKRPLAEMYDETLTETIAFLIKHKGNLRQALEDNSNSIIIYHSGVEALLKIMLEVEDFSQVPLQATQLLMDGFKSIAEGQTRMVTAKLREYYDSQVAVHRGAFDKKMTRYRDLHRKLSTWEEEDPALLPLERVHALADEVITSLKFEDLSAAEQYEVCDKYSFEERRKAAEKYIHVRPKLLLQPRPTVFQARVLDAVMNDPQAKQEMTGLVESDYRSYLAALKEHYRTGKVKRSR